MLASYKYWLSIFTATQCVCFCPSACGGCVSSSLVRIGFLLVDISSHQMKPGPTTTSDMAAISSGSQCAPEWYISKHLPKGNTKLSYIDHAPLE